MGGENSAHYKWTFLETASTGALKAVDFKGYSERFTGYLETSSGCTATVRFETRSGSSAGPYAVLGSTTMSTGAVHIQQFAGPLQWVRPYCVAKTTGGLTATLYGN
jgi:hypothetical protein